MERVKELIEKYGEIVATYDCDSTVQDEDGNEIPYEESFYDYLWDMKNGKSIKGGKDGFFIVGTNLNWRGSSGYTTAKSLEDVARKILMNDGECETLVFKSKGNTLTAVSYHHDCPTGSWFKIMTMNKAKKEYPEELKKYFMLR